MTWNPFKFQYHATYLKDEGAYALLELKKGTQTETFYFPKTLLPPDLNPGSTFTFKMEDPQSAQESELKTMQKLLEALIR
jgi:hypothetical protein